jgi:hypothetical protein
MDFIDTIIHLLTPRMQMKFGFLDGAPMIFEDIKALPGVDDAI